MGEGVSEVRGKGQSCTLLQGRGTLLRNNPDDLPVMIRHDFNRLQRYLQDA